MVAVMVGDISCCMSVSSNVTNKILTVNSSSNRTTGGIIYQQQQQQSNRATGRRKLRRASVENRAIVIGGEHREELSSRGRKRGGGGVVLLSGVTMEDSGGGSGDYHHNSRESSSSLSPLPLGGGAAGAAPLSPSYYDDPTSPISSPGSNSGSGKKGEARQCGVCGDVAKSNHFGGLSCDSCKAFFRRSVQNNACDSFSCSHDKKCNIAKSSRKSCQYCRFEKCLSIGMEKSWVMTESERRKMMEQRQERKMAQQQQRGTSGGAGVVVVGSSGGGGAAGGGGAPETDSLTSTPAMSPAEEFVMSAEMLEEIHLIEQHYKHSNELNPYYTKPHSVLSAHRTFDTWMQFCEKIGCFFSMFAEFSALGEKDKEVLMRTALTSAGIIMGAVTIDSWMGRKKIPNTIPIPKVSTEGIKDLVPGDLLMRVQNFFRKFRLICPDETMAKILILVTLYSPELSGIEDADRIQALQDHYIHILDCYIKHNYKDNPGHMFAKVLVSLADVRELAEQSFDMKFRTPPKDAVEPLNSGPSSGGSSNTHSKGDGGSHSDSGGGSGSGGGGASSSSAGGSGGIDYGGGGSSSSMAPNTCSERLVRVFNEKAFQMMSDVTKPYTVTFNSNNSLDSSNSCTNASLVSQTDSNSQQCCHIETSCSTNDINSSFQNDMNRLFAMDSSSPETHQSQFQSFSSSVDEMMAVDDTNTLHNISSSHLENSHDRLGMLTPRQKTLQRIQDIVKSLPLPAVMKVIGELNSLNIETETTADGLKFCMKHDSSATSSPFNFKEKTISSSRKRGGLKRPDKWSLSTDGAIGDATLNMGDANIPFKFTEVSIKEELMELDTEQDYDVLKMINSTMGSICDDFLLPSVSSNGASFGGSSSQHSSSSYDSEVMSNISATDFQLSCDENNTLTVAPPTPPAAAPSVPNNIHSRHQPLIAPQQQHFRFQDHHHHTRHQMNNSPPQQSFRKHHRGSHRRQYEPRCDSPLTLQQRVVSSTNTPHFDHQLTPPAHLHQRSPLPLNSTPSPLSHNTTPSPISHNTTPSPHHITSSDFSTSHMLVDGNSRPSSVQSPSSPKVHSSTSPGCSPTTPSSNNPSYFNGGLTHQSHHLMQQQQQHSPLLSNNAIIISPFTPSSHLSGDSSMSSSLPCSSTLPSPTSSHTSSSSSSYLDNTNNMIQQQTSQLLSTMNGSPSLSSTPDHNNCSPPSTTTTNDHHHHHQQLQDNSSYQSHYNNHHQTPSSLLDQQHHHHQLMGHHKTNHHKAAPPHHTQQQQQQVSCYSSEVGPNVITTIHSSNLPSSSPSTPLISSTNNSTSSNHNTCTTTISSAAAAVDHSTNACVHHDKPHPLLHTYPLNMSCLTDVEFSVVERLFDHVHKNLVRQKNEGRSLNYDEILNKQFLANLQEYLATEQHL